AGQRLLQVVLVGEPPLLATMKRRELRAFNERVSVRLQLGPLAPDELGGYVSHRVAGARPTAPPSFRDLPLQRLPPYSRGVPRVVNHLCERALSLGHDVSASVIDEPLIEAAAQDLGVMLPESAALVWGRRLGTAAALLVLMGVGAAAGAYVFRAPLGRILTR